MLLMIPISLSSWGWLHAASGLGYGATMRDSGLLAEAALGSRCQSSSVTKGMKGCNNLQHAEPVLGSPEALQEPLNDNSIKERYSLQHTSAALQLLPVTWANIDCIRLSSAYVDRQLGRSGLMTVMGNPLTFV